MAVVQRPPHAAPMTETELRTLAEVVLVGRLGSRVDTRVLPSGDEITTFTIVVDRPKGRPASSSVRVDAIACQAVRASVLRRLAGLSPGDWVQADGRLRRRFWRSGAGLGSAMEVEVHALRRVT
jgi:single-strand DNA-binding protein